MNAKPTVFVVDDDEQVRGWLRTVIESVRLPVKTYESAQDFLATEEPGGPGCLVTDMRLPGMSGLDLQDELAKRGICLPTIFITGYGDVPSAVRAMKGGALEFIEKPFSAQTLLDSVQRALDRDGVERQRREREAEQRSRLAALSARERDILDLLVEGQSSKTIATLLSLSEKTVEAHRASIRKKAGASSVAELVKLVLEAGIERPSAKIETSVRHLS